MPMTDAELRKLVLRKCSNLFKCSNPRLLNKIKKNVSTVNSAERNVKRFAVGYLHMLRCKKSHCPLKESAASKKFIDDEGSNEQCMEIQEVQE
ncbi:hypothetical protein O3M35_005104 [Rhynocoris fuscipes]|uniref:Uncharacterized protein n=1 Tax=Rhynocoris fuscipes TaxID=488301 RepID=A0AAW1DIS3_9HEMI